MWRVIVGFYFRALPPRNESILGRDQSSDANSSPILVKTRFQTGGEKRLSVLVRNGLLIVA